MIFILEGNKNAKICYFNWTIKFEIFNDKNLQGKRARRKRITVWHCAKVDARWDGKAAGRQWRH